MIDDILKALLSRVGIKEKDIDKAKELLEKVEFTIKDGKITYLLKMTE